MLSIICSGISCQAASVNIGTTVSNNDGIYALPLEQDIPDGQYVLMVFCIESQTLLGSTTFTIETTLPDITITYPSENEVIPSTTFTAREPPKTMPWLKLF